MSNLTATTRAMWDRSVYDEVYMRLILFRMLAERRQVTFKAGTTYKATVKYQEIDSLAQEYGKNETMDGGSKTTMQTVEWYRKRIQLPLELDYDDDEANSSGGDGQIFDLKERLVRDGQRGLRLKMNEIMFRAGASARDASTSADWQGMGDALAHDITYGGLTRATTNTNKWWQGASYADSFADQATHYTPSVGFVRTCIDKVQKYVENPGDLIAICGNTNWRAIQSEVEASRTYKEGPHAKFGFKSMDIDGVELFAEPYLEDDSTRKKYFFLLHLPDWRLMLSPKRKLGYFTGFTWQGSFANGLDKYLGRVMISGNTICTQPNASLFAGNVY